MIRAGFVQPSELMENLLSVAVYDEAIRLCDTFHLEAATIIRTITTRCCHLIYLKCIGIYWS